MFSTSFSRLFTLCSALASLSVGFAAPHARRAQIPSGPKFVIYTDAAIDSTTVLPPLEQIAGFNVVWCDARLSAAGWYERRGMQRFGEMFFKGEIEYVRMMREL
ncbi:hypothetical protein NUW54_g9586 [Trametes sanguinea]|uniref:Uncharacterized protein n=1 Tax=Trametes sanguinea TaxID=158606 RepID=A0ACC1P5X7_9APHY|nr:hypothetical protein NUW54_g9586 [Trametes sanguinea]